MGFCCTRGLYCCQNAFIGFRVRGPFQGAIGFTLQVRTPASLGQQELPAPCCHEPPSPPPAQDKAPEAEHEAPNTVPRRFFGMRGLEARGDIVTTAGSKKLQRGCRTISAAVSSLAWGWRTVMFQLSGFCCT